MGRQNSLQFVTILQQNPQRVDSFTSAVIKSFFFSPECSSKNMIPHQLPTHTMSEQQTQTNRVWGKYVQLGMTFAWLKSLVCLSLALNEFGDQQTIRQTITKTPSVVARNTTGCSVATQHWVHPKERAERFKSSGRISERSSGFDVSDIMSDMCLLLFTGQPWNVPSSDQSQAQVWTNRWDKSFSIFLSLSNDYFYH